MTKHFLMTLMTKHFHVAVKIPNMIVMKILDKSCFQCSKDAKGDISPVHVNISKCIYQTLAHFHYMS